MQTEFLDLSWQHLLAKMKVLVLKQKSFWFVYLFSLWYCAISNLSWQLYFFFQGNLKKSLQCSVFVFIKANNQILYTFFCSGFHCPLDLCCCGKGWQKQGPDFRLSESVLGVEQYSFKIERNYGQFEAVEVSYMST